jgi:hypothetical protein
LQAEVRGWLLVVRKGAHVPVKVLATHIHITRFRDWRGRSPLPGVEQQGPVGTGHRLDGLHGVITEEHIRLKRQVESNSSKILLYNFSTFSSTKPITSVTFSLFLVGGQPKQLPAQAHQPPGLFTSLETGGVILYCKASG